METVDSLPMAILSGQYQSPSVYKSPLSDVMSVYNQAQPGRDVAAARQEVADSNWERRSSAIGVKHDEKFADEDASIQKEIDDFASIQKEIDDLNARIAEIDKKLATEDKESASLTSMVNAAPAPAEVQ